MSAHSIAERGTQATGRSNWRAIAWATVLVIVIGLALAAYQVLYGGARSSVSALDDGERYVFVPSRGEAQVAVIDARSERVVTRIALKDRPNQVLISDAAGAMVASFAGRSIVEVVDLTDLTKRVELDLAMIPEVMVLSPDSYLMAAADGRGLVSVVSLRDRKLRLRLPGFADPRNLTFSSDGSQLYITDRRALQLIVVDIVQEAVLERIPLTRDAAADAARRSEEGGVPTVSALTRTADGRYGFVSLGGLDSVQVVDLGTLRPVKRLRVGRNPLRPYGTADGRLMLIPNDGDASVSIINTGTLEVVATLPGARDVTAINTGWFESRAFVLSRSEKRVVVLDLMKFSKLGDIGLPGAAHAGVATSTGQKLYIALADAARVAVIDAHALQLLATIEGVGRQPWGVAMARSNNYCH